jgi:hypothetical protein
LMMIQRGFGSRLVELSSTTLRTWLRRYLVVRVALLLLLLFFFLIDVIRSAEMMIRCNETLTASVTAAPCPWFKARVVEVPDSKGLSPSSCLRRPL